MKRSFFYLLFILLGNSVFSQTAGRLQAMNLPPISVSSPPNLIFVRTDSLNAFKAAIWSDLQFPWSQVTGTPSIPAQYNPTGGTGISITGTYPNQTITNTAIPSSPTFNSSPGRTLSTTGSNNTFTISSTKNARVNYTINFSFSLTLATSNGLVSLDYSTDGGSTWVTVSSVSSVFSLSITLSGNTDNNLSGDIPANALVRLYRSSNTNVTITAPTGKQQEVTY